MKTIHLTTCRSWRILAYYFVKSFIDKILDDDKTTEIYTQINIDDDKYIVFLPQKEPSFADNVLEGPETHNITTSLENINIEK